MRLAVGVDQLRRVYVRVTLGRAQACVPQQFLYRPEIRAGFEQMRRERVTQPVGTDRAARAAFASARLACVILSGAPITRGLTCSTCFSLSRYERPRTRYERFRGSHPLRALSARALRRTSSGHNVQVAYGSAPRRSCTVALSGAPRRHEPGIDDGRCERELRIDAVTLCEITWIG